MVDYENFNSMVAQTILARGGTELSEGLKSARNSNDLIKYVDKEVYLSKLNETPWDFIEL